MSINLKPSAEKVQSVLNEFGLDLNVMELSDSTRTAEEAANTIGCTVSQIAKSLIFKGKSSQQPILVIASGTNRVNEKAIKEHIGEKLRKADAGTPNAVFKLTPQNLVDLTKGNIICVK